MRRHFILYLVLAAVVILGGCGSPLSPFDSGIVNQAKDEIAPVITITYPEDNSAYSKTILISGSIVDFMTPDGDAGEVASVRYEILGTGLNDTVVPEPDDGSFSFLIQSASFTGNNITIHLTAEDLNGNTATEILNLLYQESDIATFSIVPGNSSVELSWEIPPATTEFRLLNVLSGDIEILASSVDSHVWPDLPNGELAFFQLTAEDSYGNLNNSEIISTLPMSPYTLYPEVSGNIDGVIVSWAALADAGRYVVERAEQRNGTYEIKFITSATEVYDTALADDQAYFYRVYPEGFELTKSDAARIKPLSYGEGWTAVGPSSIDFGEEYSNRHSAVYTDGTEYFLYHMTDTYTIDCVSIDNEGQLTNLGEVIDADPYAVDSILSITADNQNDILFVITGEKGVSVYDLSDPGAPVLDKDTPATYTPYNFGVADPYFNAAAVHERSGNNYLYLTTYAAVMQIEYTYSTISGLSTVSVDTFTFPTSPQLYSSDTLYYNESTDELYSHYYCTTGGQQSEGYYAFDLSTPSSWRTSGSPVQTEVASGTYESCIDINGDDEKIVLLKNDGVELYNAVSGAKQADIPILGTMKSITLDGNLLLVSTYSRGVQIINLNSQVPGIIGDFSTEDLAQEVHIINDQNFALTNSNFEEFEISIPDTFTYSSFYEGPNMGSHASNWYYAGVVMDESLILGRLDGSTTTLDVWTLADGTPSSASQLFTPRGYSFTQQGQRLLISDVYSEPAIELYMTEVEGGTITTEYTGPGAYRYMAFRGEDFYGGSDQRLILFDSPATSGMTEVSSVLLDKSISGNLSFKDDYIYVPTRWAGGLSIVRKNDEAELELVSVVSSTVFSPSSSVSLLDSEVVDEHLYVLYEDTNSSYRMTGLVVFSLADPSSPVEVDRSEYSYYIDSQSKYWYAMTKLEVSGHILMCMTGEGHSNETQPGRGIKLFDISEPASISEIGEIDLSPIVTEFYDDYGSTPTSEDFIVDGNDIYFISRYGMWHIKY